MHGSPGNGVKTVHNHYSRCAYGWTGMESDGSQERVLRGGGWNNKACSLRSSVRYSYPATAQYALLGFRIVAVAANRLATHSAKENWLRSSYDHIYEAYTEVSSLG